MRDKEGHYTMMKGEIYQDDINFINIHTPNFRVPKYMKQTLTELERELFLQL